MLDEFKKAQQEKSEEKEHIILPDSADPDILAEDGKPLTNQLKGIYEMREKIAEEKPSNMEIKPRERDLPATADKTINSALRQVPKLCDQCYLIDKCPHYQEGATCYFRNQINIEGRDSILDLMKMVLEMQGERVMFGRLIEQSEGGYLDGNLSKEMKSLMDYMKDFKEIMAPPKEEITIKASGPSQQGGGGGILSQLFGGGGGNDRKDVGGE
jgi:hypothetical protein